MNPPPSPPTPHKILVVDDNPFIRQTICLALRDQGYSVLLSGEITEALQIVRKERPSVILLDINFPPNASVSGVLDGFWALDWMHCIKDTKDIPVIIISSDDPATAKPNALAAGAAAYFHKPINKDQLTAAITELLAKQSPSMPRSVA